MEVRKTRHRATHTQVTQVTQVTAHWSKAAGSSHLVCNVSLSPGAGQQRSVCAIRSADPNEYAKMQL